MRFLALVLALAPLSAIAADVALVAAAADLSFAMREIADSFRRETGREVKLSFGSSGNFRHQIAAGAPFQLFMSADESYVLALHRERRTLDEGRLYAVGRIVLFVPKGAPLAPDPELKDLRRALAAGAVRRFAIANPEHAPYGRAAREALQKLGLWETLKDRLVLGENVSQAAQFASSGSAQGGIIALSLALSPEVSVLGRHCVLPAELHAPLRQRMALLRGAGETARELYGYLQQAGARAVLKRYGFVLPGE
ncbi:MAG: molybdate ABC transporter substrate-binding protein [Betaproteobacteria bacterium RIFCSPLOWO2_12_FULL_65_14]|nr:MAG: molybdate ABC transporter substrate-binding protein [Betaproteobacteria bacterium RIFCSPLOWO2_12_FULL_65_14]